VPLNDYGIAAGLVVFVEPVEILGQGLELVDVIGGGVAGEANDEEAVVAGFAEHLGFHGTPADDGVGGEIPFAEEFVGGFGGAGVGAGEDFRVGDDEALVAGDGVAAEVQPGGEVFRDELRVEAVGRVGGVAGVNAVDAEDAVDAGVGGGVGEDLAEGAAAGALAGDGDVGEGEAGGGLGCGDERGEAGGVGEELDVGSGARAGLDGDDGKVVLLAGGELREPVSAVEEEEEFGGVLVG
jgi:hypothetical protein